MKSSKSFRVDLRSETRQIVGILKKAFQLFSNSNPLLLSAATAFFATFALSPILIILSHLLNVFFDRKIMLPKLFDKIGATFGDKATHDIRRIVESFLSLESNVWITIALSIFFYFIATTLLSAVRQSIHQLWEIKKKPSRKVDYHLKERGIEVAMIVLIGVLFLVTLVIDSGLAAYRNFLDSFSPAIAYVLFHIPDVLLSILIVATWFSVVYRFMPEARVSWKVALAGGSVTGFLFILGRILLTKVLVHSKIEELFGPSSSIAMILLFIFYCSFILYFGAAFTLEYAKATHHPIHPGKLGEKYQEVVVEAGTRKGKR